MRWFGERVDKSRNLRLFLCPTRNSSVAHKQTARHFYLGVVEVFWSCNPNSHVPYTSSGRCYPTNHKRSLILYGHCFVSTTSKVRRQRTGSLLERDANCFHGNTKRFDLGLLFGAVLFLLGVVDTFYTETGFDLGAAVASLSGEGMVTSAATVVS